MSIIPIFTLILLYILISISIEDLKTMLISENKLIFLTTSGLAYLIYSGLENESLNVIDLMIKKTFSMFIVFILMYTIGCISNKIIGVKLLGIGDIKLFSISIIWLGIELSFISLCISFLLSAIYSLHAKIFNRLKIFQQYPFAPFISIGIFSSWIIDKI